MRRTTEKGWVAKAYPAAPSSQTDLAMLDDLSDAGSLDSFFDDEFDLEQPQEKLNSLLSCNTLGVEARVRGLLSILQFPSLLLLLPLLFLPSFFLPYLTSCCCIYLH